MVMHTDEVGGSVVAGAVSVTLALTLAVSLAISLVVLWSGTVVFRPSDPVSVASTTRAPGSCTGWMNRGLALHDPTIMTIAMSEVNVLKDGISSFG